MARDEHLFTSESVTEGHPDKIADQVSDAVLDAIIRQDPTGRVACETLLTTGLVVVGGPDHGVDHEKNHVGGGDKFLQNFPALLGLQIQCDGALVRALRQKTGAHVGMVQRVVAA